MMQSEKLPIYQTILEHFKSLQADIDYSRYLTEKPDCTILIENKNIFVHWLEQTKTIISAIHQESLILHDAVNQDESPQAPLNTLETTIEELIHLHTEITVSCAHESGLMEGRYLIEHATGQYLDQISQHINEFRYQLNQLIFSVNGSHAEQQNTPALPSLLLTITDEIEMDAFNDWLLKK
ncbi:MAG: hypothetical protein V3U84_07410 [Thiotrichaceae bacterium]